MPATLYRGMLLHSIGRHSVEWFSDGALLGEGGKILAVGDFPTIHREFPGVNVVDWSGSILIPGLVDTHAHIPQLNAVGSDRRDLLTWLEHVIYPLEQHYTEPDAAHVVADAFFRRVIAAGTTAIAAYAPASEDATNVCFEVADRYGIRALLGMTMMDQNVPAPLRSTASELIAATERLAHRWHKHRRLLYCITPRFAGSCSRELLRKCGELAVQLGLPVQTHLAESPAELRYIAELYPEHPDYTSVYEHAGLVTNRTILAHCIYLSSSEQQRLCHASAAIAHCPASNAYLQSGIMPLVEYLDTEKLRIGLGTDIGAGYHASILEEARTARELAKLRMIFRHTHRIPTHEEAFYLATLGGAGVLNLSNEIGNFLQGKWADFVRIECEPYRPITSASDALAYILYAATNKVCATVIEGTIVWQQT